MEILITQIVAKIIIETCVELTNSKDSIVSDCIEAFNERAKDNSRRTK